MARQIRLSAAEAIAAGLIDPAVAELARKPAKSSVVKNHYSKNTSPPKKAKRRRSVSRPASHPKISAGPPGHGSVKLNAEGRICSAELHFDLVPVPKERPRVVKDPATDKTFGFTPSRTKHFTVEVSRVVDHVFAGRSPISGPVSLTMTFVIQVPKSWPKWKKEAALEGLIVPTGRPDMDNLEKALLDAFNEKLIVDDAYVIVRHARKIYGEMPMITASVEQTGQLDINVKREDVEALRALRKAAQLS